MWAKTVQPHLNFCITIVQQCCNAEKKRKYFSSCIEIIVKSKMISCPSAWQRRSLVAKNSRYTLSGLLNFLSGLLNFFVRFAQSFVRFAQSFVRFAQIFVAPAFRQNRLNIAQVNIFVSNFYIFTQPYIVHHPGPS